MMILGGLKNVEKEFGGMEYNAENIEKIKKYAGLKNSNAQNLDEVLEEIRAGKLQEGERAFLKQLKGTLINEMGKELAEGEKSTIQTAENINAGIVNKTRGTLQGRTFYAKKIKGSSSTENAADMKIYNAAPTFTSETIEPEPFNNSIDDKNTKINEREKTLKENIEEDAAPERQAKYREIVGRYAGEKTIGNMDKLAKRLGSEVIYYVGDTQEEGYYKDGKIYLNANLIEVRTNGSAEQRGGILRLRLRLRSG